MLTIKNFFKSLFKNTHYVSELDAFLKSFDQAHPHLSKSQQYESEKYKRIYQLRDNKITMPVKKTVWDKF